MRELAARVRRGGEGRTVTRYRKFGQRLTKLWREGALTATMICYWVHEK